MNRSVVSSSVALLLFACSGAGTGVDDGSSSKTEEELRATQACEDKACGESCTLCAPGQQDCFETAELKQCSASGRCSSAVAECEGASDAGPAPDASPAPFVPCAGKTCGDTCTICPPGDPGCFETAALKFCHSDGACSAAPPACIPPPPYDACAGKACGDACTICRPGDPGCFETAVLKRCNAAGTCSASPSGC